MLNLRNPVTILMWEDVPFWEEWGSPGFVDRSQGYAGMSLGVETNCCS